MFLPWSRCVFFIPRTYILLQTVSFHPSISGSADAFPRSTNWNARKEIGMARRNTDDEGIGGDNVADTEKAWTIVVGKDGKDAARSDDFVIVEVVRSALRKDISRTPVPLVQLTAKIDALRSAAAHYDDEAESLLEFLSLIEGERAATDKAAAARIAAGRVSFDDIPALLRRGLEVAFSSEGEISGGLCKGARVMDIPWGKFVCATITIYRHGSIGAMKKDVQVNIPKFGGSKAVHSLDVRPILPEEKAALTERGRRFRDLVSGAKHVGHEGAILAYRERSWFPTSCAAIGRAMIDAETYRKVDPETFGRFSQEQNHPMHGMVGGGAMQAGAEIPDAHLFACSPWVLGFSFTAKRWGAMRVEAIRDADLRSEAFDMLVLPKDTKSLVKGLADKAGGGFADIVAGKGGGTIILLHGNPGVGKTLTAEALADRLGRPLYSVSVGELGSTPESLEEGLSNVLAMATAWNAVLLLDEADIYLEKRDRHDIARNSMVAIFLRLLEYYQGLMFLTTNRVAEFDPAFHSRISLALRYGDLDEEARGQVWATLLGAAGFFGAEVSAVAGKTLNGRQIKNAIRMAQSLAASEQVEPSQEHLLRVLEVVETFSSES